MRKFLPVVAILIICALALTARAAIYLHMEGIKGAVDVRGHNAAISVLKFNLELSSPRDPATGAAGRVIQKPLTIVKELDAASPQLVQALTSNERFKLVSLHFVKPNAQGVEEIYYTINLHNASICNIRQFTDETNHNVEEVSLSYDKLEIEVPSAAQPPHDREPDVIRIPFPHLK